MILIVIICAIVGIFSFMVKSGVFSIDKSEQDTPGSVIDNSDRIDSYGTKGVVSLGTTVNEEVKTEHNKEALIQKQKYLKNQLYQITGNHEKMHERYALVAELKKIEKELEKLNNQ